MRLELKERQKLVATAAMQQAFLVLQMPTYELAAWLQAQIDQNPVLECQEAKGEPLVHTPTPEIDFEKQSFEVLDDLDETFCGSAFPDEFPRERKKEATSAYPLSLFEHLMQQAKEFFSSQEALAQAEAIIGNLDSRGFLGDAPADPDVLRKIQEFDPPGIAARNLQESLLIQLRFKRKEHSIAYCVIERYFEELLHNQFPELAKRLKIPIKELQATLQKEIAFLDFHPGYRFLSFTSPPLVPDVFIEKIDNTWQIILNDSHLPRFQIVPPAIDTLKSEEKAYVRAHIAQGKWLLRTLRKRHDTLKKIAHYLLKKQAHFFNGQPHKFQPLTLREAALELGFHESTVARAINDKYLSSPQGIFSLKSFFTHALHTPSGKKISTRTARDQIASLVASEDRHRPLSDEALVLALAKQGIPCARRTIAKYRKSLKIPKASQRKRWD